MKLKQFTLGGLLAMAMLLPSLAFADLVAFDCKFPIYSDKETAGNKELGDGMAFTYVLNTTDGSASVLGVNGAAPVAVISGPRSETLNFIEVTEAGNVMTTVVVLNTGEAAHSRHSYVGFVDFVLRPSQYYGTCKIL